MHVRDKLAARRPSQGISLSAIICMEEGESLCRFMDGVENFDAACFGIHASEALVMDPQQRLMLEVSTRII